MYFTPHPGENDQVFFALLAIFIIVPLLELWVIFEVGAQIGFAATFLVLILISVSGAALAKRQGYRVVARIQQEVAQGRMPGDALIEGALVLAGALLLLTPGFITDAAGLLVLLPPSRAGFRRLIKSRLKSAVQRRAIFFGPGPGPGAYHGPGGTGAEPEQRRKELEG